MDLTPKYIMRMANIREKTYSKRPYPNGWTLSACFFARRAETMMKAHETESVRLFIPSSVIARDPITRPEVIFRTERIRLTASPIAANLTIREFRSSAFFSIKNASGTILPINSTMHNLFSSPFLMYI